MDFNNQVKNEKEKQKQVVVDLSSAEMGAHGPNSSVEAMDVVQHAEDHMDPIAVVTNIPTDEEDALLNSQPVESVKVQSPSAESKPVTERVKLCGAARKRLRTYLDEGIDIETARKLCVKPMREARKEVNELTVKRKRVRSDGSSPPEKKHPAKRTADMDVDGTPRKADKGKIIVPVSAMPATQHQLQSQAAPSYKETVETTKIGVIPPDFPKTRWSDKQLEAIQSAVKDKIRELRKGVVKPAFSSCSFKPGWLSFGCRDTSTVQWLETHVPTLKPWSDAKLKVAAESDVPKAQVFVGYFPEKKDTSNEEILELIEGQNCELSVEYWKVLNRVIKGAIIELTLSIDPISSDLLKRKNHNVNYGYGSALIRPTRQQNEVRRGITSTVKAATSTAPAKSSDGGTHAPAKLDDKPGCSKDTVKPSSFRPPLNIKARKQDPNRSKSDRPKKWERNSAEEAALLNTNRGRKVAKRAAKNPRK